MHLHYLFAVIRRWLGRERALAPCCVKARRRLSVILFLAVAASTRLTTASVLINGNVLPVDNPFSPFNEGLPSDGNFVNQFATPIANQQNYEGILVGTTQVVNFTITVGQTSFGTLTINGESELRDENLIIGSSKSTGGNQTAIGSGVVRITGSGSLFNSDPAILSPDAYAASTQPDPPIPPVDPAFIVPVTAFQKRSLTQGFDLIVGQAGTGTLEISAGGRGEIQDAIVAGDQVGSTGSIVVDGIDSYLGQGANMPPGSLTPSPTDPHGTIIGQQGLGVMTITNGATVESNITGGGTSNGPIVAGSIGSVPFVQGNDNTTSGAGGSGIVTVDGTASKWITHGSMQVGGFIDIPGMAATTPTDITGDTSLYTSKFGQGVLNVQNGAIVNVTDAVGTTDTTTNPLYLAVGHFGTINMNGGFINVGELNDTGGQSNSQSRGPNNQLVNDGVIQGTGTIQTGVFRNRHLGTVRVLAGQNLIISASSDFTTGSTPDQLPLQNYGTIQALGNSQATATLEFSRANTGDTTRPVTRFQNFRLNPTATIPVQGGVISAQWSTLHFDSGLNNFGVLAFTAGDNYVTGDVINQATGTIFANGPGTRVTFQDDLNCGLGTCSFVGTTVNVIKGLTFISAGNLIVSPTTTISTAGNAGITGGLTVNLSGVTFGSLHEGDIFQILSVTGSIGGVDFSDPTTPKVDLTIPGRFTNLFLPSLTSIGLPATDVLIPFYTSNAVYLGIESLGAASGPDFNGDGVVNGLDLQIWLANVGIQSGATVLQGDANGDGKVDGNDFLIWQRSRGAFPGAGSGLAGGSATIPEPASFALVLLGAIAALPIRRRLAG